MLKKQAVAYLPESADADRNVQYGMAIPLSNIWIRVTNGQARTAEGAAPAASGKLVFDTALSKPEWFIPVTGMKIVHNGEEFYAQSVTMAGVEDKPSHYEVTLI